MIGFGENSCSGVSSMDMMMPLTSNSDRQFLPLPLSNNSGNGAQSNSSDQRVSASALIVAQDHNYSQDHAKAKIMAHPLFPRLLSAYLNCQKVGAPSEVVAGLEEVWTKYESSVVAAGRGTGSVGEEDPALDQFMEAYCEMLIKYEQELTKPFNEAMLFFSRIESQLKALAISTDSGQSGSSSQDEVDVHHPYIDPQAEDRELKVQLLRKYSGYLGSLKQEFLKKKKYGKLPKEARQHLLDWWSKHYKWPYPSESQKLVLAESTGLDMKQINNWFINQRNVTGNLLRICNLL